MAADESGGNWRQRVITGVWHCGARTRARVRAGPTGCREHCHAFPESGSGLHRTVKLLVTVHWLLFLLPPFFHTLV